MLKLRFLSYRLYELFLIFISNYHLICHPRLVRGSLSATTRSPYNCFRNSGDDMIRDTIEVINKEIYHA